MSVRVCLMRRCVESSVREAGFAKWIRRKDGTCRVLARGALGAPSLCFRVLGIKAARHDSRSFCVDRLDLAFFATKGLPFCLPDAGPTQP